MNELKPKSWSSVLLLIFLIFSLLLGALSLLPLLSKSLKGSSASPLEIILSLPFFSISLALFLLYKLVQQPSRPRLFISSEELRMGETEKFKIQWSLEVFVHPRWWFFRFKYAFTLVCLPPLPVKTFKPLEPYGGTPIQINEGRINFAPPPTTFRFEIPADAPPSFSSQLVSLSWELKLQAKRRGLQLRGKQLAREHLIVSPTGEKLTAFPSKKLMSYAS